MCVPASYLFILSPPLTSNLKTFLFDCDGTPTKRRLLTAMSRLSLRTITELMM